MSETPPERYERAPAEGEFYDPKGYKLLRHFRTWAKIATVLMALMLLVTVVGAIIDEDPVPFFVVFFAFVITLGFVGIVYDRALAQHKTRVQKAKMREREAMQQAAGSPKPVGRTG